MIPNKILIATDGSPAARNAEAFAAALANTLGVVEVVVANVVPPREMPLVKGGAYYPSTDAQIEDAESVVAEAAERVQAAITSAEATVRALLIESFSPANGIIEEAHSGGTCSLIVMGSRGHGGFASLVMGSVSTQVLQHAHCPVLIVKD